MDLGLTDKAAMITGVMAARRACCDSKPEKKFRPQPRPRTIRTRASSNIERINPLA
jgi:hypothetical protein